MFFEYDEKRFFHYRQNNGAWEAVPFGVIKEVVRSEWERYTKLFQEPRLALKNDDSLINALASGIQSHSGRNKVLSTPRVECCTSRAMAHVR